MNLDPNVLVFVVVVTVCGVRYGLAGKVIALNSDDKEKEVTFEANEVRGIT